jgi:hypothetical protein
MPFLFHKSEQKCDEQNSDYSQLMYLLTNYTQHRNKAHMYKAEILFTCITYRSEFHLTMNANKHITIFAINRCMTM